MKIIVIGFNHEHDRSFIMDRPDGPGSWLFLLIKTSARFEINGESMTARPGSAVLLRPTTPVRYCALGDEYTDDWFYFTEEEGDLERFEKLGIPADTIIYLGRTEELSSLLHVMSYEHYSAEPLHEEIERAYLDVLLLRLSRSIAGKRGSGAELSDRNARLTHIRTRIYTQPDEISDINGLAKEAGMSRSGFQHLYKRMFGVSVISDIIEGRLETARRLLTSTDLTVEEIARSSGYPDGSALMRQFKQKCGVTPTEFRKGAYGNT